MCTIQRILLYLKLNQNQLKAELIEEADVFETIVKSSAFRTEDPGLESRQGTRFLGIYTLQCCCHNLMCIVIV
jgi:hypothetical protein